MPSKRLALAVARATALPLGVGVVVAGVVRPTVASAATSGGVKFAYYDQWSIYQNAFFLKNVDNEGIANKIDFMLYDFANVDPTNNSLPTLISTLKAAYNPHRPVHISTIAFGKDADVQALKQISAATGGHSYLARKPQDINTIFAEVALQNA